MPRSTRMGAEDDATGYPRAAPAEHSPFAAGRLPPPESPSHRLATHYVAILAIAASAAYLTWRAAFTLGSDLWISIPLLLLELHAAAGLVLYTFSLWDLDSAARPAPVEETELRVAVLVPTYNEPREVLLPTISAAVSLDPVHETWVLDDGGRPWVRDLCRELGACYLARADHVHAKAGNINHALSSIEADVVAVLDADHVATEGFLSHTLGYFSDPKVALVQTPQDFYNADSFEHGTNRSWLWPTRRVTAFNEQRLFYRALQPGKNRWEAAFWCGTNAVVRVAALEEVGGVAHESVTEDIHTTIRMHRKGWRSVYHNEVLAYGLAARDAREYQLQRVRWGTGAMQLLRQERPLTGPGLSLTQRLAYATTLLGWFDAWRTLGYVLIPIIVLFSGAVPIHASPGIFFLAFGTTFVLHRIALSTLSRGYAPQGMAMLFEFARMQSSIQATLAFAHRRERRFEVTTKGAVDQRQRVAAPVTLWLLLALTIAAFAWFGCTLAGLTPITYSVKWTAYGALGWGLVNAVFLVAAIARIASTRFAADRRVGPRLKIGSPVELDAHPAQLLDLSVGGALVRLSDPLSAHSGQHTLRIPFDGELELAVAERNRRSVGDDGVLVGLQFLPGQDYHIARLATAVFGSRVASHRALQSRQPAA